MTFLHSKVEVYIQKKKKMKRGQCTFTFTEDNYEK